MDYGYSDRYGSIIIFSNQFNLFGYNNRVTICYFTIFQSGFKQTKGD